VRGPRGQLVVANMKMKVTTMKGGGVGGEGASGISNSAMQCGANVMLTASKETHLVGRETPLSEILNTIGGDDAGRASCPSNSADWSWCGGVLGALRGTVLGRCPAPRGRRSLPSEVSVSRVCGAALR
jgi:hypothetical protein